MSGMITAAGAARWLTSSALRSSIRYPNVSCHQPQSFSGGQFRPRAEAHRLGDTSHLTRLFEAAGFREVTAINSVEAEIKGSGFPMAAGDDQRTIGGTLSWVLNPLPENVGVAIAVEVAGARDGRLRRKSAPLCRIMLL